MKTFREFINEATTNVTATVESSLYGGTLTFNIYNISGGPETNWGEPINGIALKISAGPNTLPWPLIGLAKLDSTNSPLTFDDIPGMCRSLKCDLWYDGNLVSATIGAGDQDDNATVSELLIKDNKITARFSASKSPDLKGKYKSFVVEFSMKSLFGSKADSVLDQLKSNDLSNDLSGFAKLTRTVEYKNKESVSVKFKH